MKTNLQIAAVANQQSRRVGGVVADATGEESIVGTHQPRYETEVRDRHACAPFLRIRSCALPWRLRTSPPTDPPIRLQLGHYGFLATCPLPATPLRVPI